MEDTSIVPYNYHARFKLVLHTTNAVIIKDMGPHDKHLTITNDAEWVVQRLQVQYMENLLTPKKRLFYVSSDRDLHELVLNWGETNGFARFAGFRALSPPEHA